MKALRSAIDSALMQRIRPALKLVSIFSVLFFLTSPTLSQSNIPGQITSFIFTPAGFHSSKQLNVYLYKSSTSTPDSKVIVALHGVERSGLRACENWIDTAEKRSLIVLAPEFTLNAFPRSEFQMAGMNDSDRSHWLFEIVDQVFDQAKKEMNLHSTGFILFGHSAGAQFAHRYALMSSSPKADIIVAANAGSYMSPAYQRSFLDIPYPWSLSEGYTPRSELPNIYSRNFHIFLGNKDIDTSSDSFPKSTQAAHFGVNRLERGINFYNKAQEFASENGSSFKWKLHIVPNVGHNSKAMAQATAAFLFP